jgi:hypothetical protein
MLAISKAADPN